MAVTKATYTATATWTAAQLADLFEDAFIDAGLMTAWHDSFTAGSNAVRVLKIEHDNTKTYGNTFYYLAFTTGFVGVSIASGWDTATDLPTGTQYIDYFNNPNSTSSTWGDVISFTPSASSNISLDRYTSATDIKQSWFVLRQGLNRSTPFTVLHEDTSLHAWLDLSKGMISGYHNIVSSVSNRRGNIDFRMQNNLRRCLLIGSALRGETSSNGRYHGINYSMNSYFGVGSVSAETSNNVGTSGFSGFALPVAKNSANPAFTTDYIPICTDLAWSIWTPTKLADDFGVYMHYADNTLAYGDRFIVTSGTNEWEVLNFANNSVVTDGASSAFLARVV